MTTSANGYDPTSIDRVSGLLDWVTVKGMFEGRPTAVIHDTGQRVWLLANYADDLPERVVVITDGYGDGYDQNGNKLVSVPAEWCSFIDSDEAHNINMCMDADEELRGYAN